MNYIDLVAEAAARADVPGVAARAAYYVGQAENYLNKALRIAGQEKTEILATDSAGEADLPADFLQLRSTGSAAVYGNRLLTGVVDGHVTLTYYAKLPPLAENGTNWLLDAEPETYLQAVLLQIYMTANDAPKVQATSQVLGTLLEAIKRQDRMARYNGQRIDSTGMSYVR